MALILDIITKDIPLDNVFNWLSEDSTSSDLEEILKNNVNVRDSFPLLLVDFIRDQTSRILKYNNVCPVESPVREVGIQNQPTSNLLSPPYPHKNGNGQDSKKVRRIFAHKLDIQSQSAFPPLQSTPKKETPKKRRINPTQLMPSPIEASRTGSVKFGMPSRPSFAGNPFNQAKEQAARGNLDQERALLKEHKQQVPPTVIHEVASNPPIPMWACTEPELSSVTHESFLDRLSHLYAYCLSKNLITSLYAEIKFLINLLLIRVSPDRYQCEEGYLSSVHNCVYFSCKSLQLITNLWPHVEHSTLRLLLKNNRLVTFAPQWVVQLSQLESLAVEKKSQLMSANVGNVSFQSDTDNRLNFASEMSFRVFRKQRDQFCDVWQTWKQNNSSGHWRMSSALQKSIQSLVDLKKDCVNYVHLARLFRSQLLDVAQLADVKEESGPLGLLQYADPEKLRRLKERLVNPPTENRAKDGVTFEGDQEFFHDFIVLANSPAFNEHLKNNLVSGIDELSSTYISSEDRDEYGHFAQTLISLQVMAKFLAFLTFFPHTSSDHLPEHIFHDLSQLRRTQKLPIDLYRHVDDAMRKGRLILIVPWVVTFLSLADSVSLCLPNCHAVLCYLVHIFRTISISSDRLTSKNGFLLRMLLSWLFDQSNFPRSFLSKTDAELSSHMHTTAMNDPALIPSNESQLLMLDEYPVVDTAVVYQCCPHLWTWKNLLLDFCNTDTKWGDKGSVSRKITPISAEDPSHTTKLHTKSLQLSLEENFFHNQPSSVKRTVDFVSDRLASNVVRDVRHQIIPRLALSGQTNVRTWPTDSQRIDEKLEALSDQLCRTVRQKMLDLAASGTSPLDVIMESLLPNDVLPQVRAVCVAVTAKLARLKIHDWMECHVTIAEWNKLDKNTQRSAQVDNSNFDPAVSLADHNGKTWPASQLIERLKTLIGNIIRDPAKLSADQVVDMLGRSEETLLNRYDVTAAAFKCLLQLTFDFVFIICVFQPEIITGNTIASWAEFWSRAFPRAKLPNAQSSSSETPSSASILIVFAPKQLLLLAQSTSTRQSWDHITRLVIELFKKHLIRYRDIEEQAVAVVRQEWPHELLQRFATCIQDIVDWQKSQQSTANSHRINDSADGDSDYDVVDGELLTWLSWFCSSLEEDLL